MLFVDPNARPFSIHKARPVPVHWQQEVKEGLDRDVTIGVLRGPLADKPAEWCMPMHIAAKKNGKPARWSKGGRRTHSGDTPTFSTPEVPATV